jgi:two-component system, cell cycle sensor histidine kinase and response regulator CckA
VATPKSNRKSGRPQKKTPRRSLTPSASQKRPQTILLVEDDADARASVQRMLKRLGYGVIEAATADAACEMLAAPNASVDLVLTDIVMNGMSGRELAVRLSIERPTVPLLLMSGHSADDMELQEDELAHFVRKPFSIELLAEHVAAALRGDQS